MLAGGVESMTRSPFVMLKPDRAFPRRNRELVDTTIGWRFINPRMAENYSTESMGETAENVAERYGVSREDQDAFALESHRRAIAAQEAGKFDEEIVAVEAPQPKGRRDGPLRRGAARRTRRSRSWRSCARCSARAAPSPPATRRRSTTAPPASCSPRTTGSSSSATRAARAVVSVGAAGVDPAYMGVGPVPAMRKALDRAGLTADDIDLVELNEAFAGQVLASMRELGIPHEKLNVNGGAIALGHPLGCSGARLVTSLAWEMRRRGARYGTATMCIGVGQGLAMVIERPAAAPFPFYQ